MEDQRIKEILIEKNYDFKKMYLKHQEYEQQLKEIGLKNLKTDKELIKEQSIKKQKLRIKDEMQRYIIDYRKRVV